uniref:Uncharacterized protein n=1 Tax=Steinernema glaseri TaxID=37863 RepID=A0A1I7ZCZ3_9BILA
MVLTFIESRSSGPDPLIEDSYRVRLGLHISFPYVPFKSNATVQKRTLLGVLISGNDRKPWRNIHVSIAVTHPLSKAGSSPETRPAAEEVL